MVARFGNLHPTMLATVYSQLQQASHITSERTIEEIRQSEFFMQKMQELSDIAKVTASKF